MTDLVQTITDNTPLITLIIGIVGGHLSGFKIQQLRSKFALFVTLMDKIQKMNADNTVTPETFTGALESGIALIKQ